MGSKIKNYEFKSGLGLEIEIIPIAETIKAQKDKMGNPHRTEFYNIFWIEKGSPTHLIDFNPIAVPENSLLFINKGRVISFDKESKYDGKGILFTDNFFCKSEKDTKFLHSTILFTDLLSTPLIRLGKSSGDLLNLLIELEKELKNTNDTFHFEILHNYLHNFLLIAERERRKQGFQEIKRGPDLDYTILFKDLLDENFGKIKTVGAYADLINVSEKRLTKATSTSVGKTPKELIDERVMLEAKRLLVHTNLTIKEIGFELGFDEPTNFIKYFRKHINKTPIEFRENYLS